MIFFWYITNIIQVWIGFYLTKMVKIKSQVGREGLIGLIWPIRILKTWGNDIEFLEKKVYGLDIIKYVCLLCY